MLAITGTIRGTSKGKLYQELGLESPELRRSYFYEIFNKQSPTYLLNIILKPIRSYFTRYVENVRHDFSENSFFPSTVIEWNKINKTKIPENQKVLIYKSFKKSILTFIRPS